MNTQMPYGPYYIQYTMPQLYFGSRNSIQWVWNLALFPSVCYEVTKKISACMYSRTRASTPGPMNQLTLFNNEGPHTVIIYTDVLPQLSQSQTATSLVSKPTHAHSVDLPLSAAKIP